jgi:hypothetical protein
MLAVSSIAMLRTMIILSHAAQSLSDDIEPACSGASRRLCSAESRTSA